MAQLHDLRCHEPWNDRKLAGIGLSPQACLPHRPCSITGRRSPNYIYQLVGLQEHPGQVFEAHFGRYRDFGLYTDSLAFYGAYLKSYD